MRNRIDTVIGHSTTALCGMTVGVVVGAFLLAPPCHAEPASPGPGTTITEDDPRWDCTTMGDLVCGPDNAQGAHPGRYAYGNLVASWPMTKRCRPVIETNTLLCETRPAKTMDGDW